MSTSSAKNTISNGSVLIRSASSAGSVAFPCVEHSELDPMVSVVVRSPCPLPREARRRTAPSVRRQSRSGTLATVPTATPTAPGSARPPRPGPKNTRPRFHRCSAHRTRPHSAHRPRSRPVSGLSLRQLASDPFHPVEGGSANDYDYSNADPQNGWDLDGTQARGPNPFGCTIEYVGGNRVHLRTSFQKREVGIKVRLSCPRNPGIMRLSVTINRHRTWIFWDNMGRTSQEQVLGDTISIMDFAVKCAPGEHTYHARIEAFTADGKRFAVTRFRSPNVRIRC